MTRQEFEAFLSSPGYLLSVERWSNDKRNYPFSGQYKVQAVQLAWEVLVEAQRRIATITLTTERSAIIGHPGAAKDCPYLTHNQPYICQRPACVEYRSKL